MNDPDHYEAYYAEKLWHLLPAIYRAEDSDIFDRQGSLRELVNRLGAQAAILRRSLDRQWEDQSIETCDDWVIAYMGDLLATNLVASLDARGQRLDVAKTIYYRRRKGTVAILEEIAADITGWDARVVEFFRRMSRTRHNLDPAIGLPAETTDPPGNRSLQTAQGLVGTLTKTTIGGFADIRNPYGASKARSAFDEFFYTADVRRGKGQVGWHNIPRLGVFLWRLKSFGLEYSTPVKIKGCSDYYTFDPTGRSFDPKDTLTGIYAKSSRAVDDRWISPAEWQLPTPISKELLVADLDLAQPQLYAIADATEPNKSIFNSVGVYRQPGNFYERLRAINPNPEVQIYPKHGRFKLTDATITPYVTYHYGFSAAIGATSDERRIFNNLTKVPANAIAVSGGGDLSTELTSITPTGTLLIKDSLTYTQVRDLGTTTPIQSVTIMAENKARPVIRPPATATNPTIWTFTGAKDSSLVLEGLLISGIEIVLTGEFKSVTLNNCTLDPGEFDGSKYAEAADGKVLNPSRLWIEAQIEELIIDRCITSAIATRDQGSIEHLIAKDSILQAFYPSPEPLKLPEPPKLPEENVLYLTSGKVILNRCTLLGAGKVHQLEASECIFNDVLTVDNYQQGCVRFSAWSTESKIPRPYESVEIPRKYPLFTSRTFGHPGYAQLQLNADAAIISSTGGGKPTILEGAQDGSEMGALASNKNAIKERSLRIKYEEYMPLGLIPVIVYVT
jgi:hypothetical protein